MATLIETASNTLATAGTTITVTTAGAPNAGEKLIAVVHHTDDFPATPAGWTKDKEDAASGVVTIFSKTAAGTEGTSFVFTAPTSGGMSARVMRYSGVGALHAIVSGSSTGSGTVSSGVLNTSVVDVFMVAAGALQATTLPAADLTPSSGFTKLATDLKSTNTGGKSMLQVATGVAATAGSYTYTGTYTPATTTTAEAALVGYLQTNPDGAVTAVRAQGSGAAGVPAVVGGGTGSVTAVRAQGTGQGEAPVITGATVVTGGAAATGTGAAGVPTVSGGSTGAVTAVRAQGTGAAGAPVVTGGAVGAVTAVRAQGSGLVRPPTVQGGTVSTLPAVVTHGAVKAWLGSGVNVSPDADGYADLIPDVGTVTFTPVAKVLTFPSASPAPLILTPRVVVCTLDSDGYLIGTKAGGTEKLVRLIAGDWMVSYQLTGGITLAEHKITVTAAHTTAFPLDLATEIPL